MSLNVFRCCFADVFERASVLDAFSLVANEVEFGFGWDS